MREPTSGRPSPKRGSRSRTDWDRVAAQSDKDIDAAIAGDADAAPALDAEWFRGAKLVLPERKTLVSLRVDPDVLRWYKARGRGYQTRMNAVLRAYMDSVTRGPAKPRRPK